jgi:hypothetical protein
LTDHVGMSGRERVGEDSRRGWGLGKDRRWTDAGMSRSRGGLAKTADEVRGTLRTEK